MQLASERYEVLNSQPWKVAWRNPRRCAASTIPNSTSFLHNGRTHDATRDRDFPENINLGAQIETPFICTLDSLPSSVVLLDNTLLFVMRRHMRPLTTPSIDIKHHDSGKNADSGKEMTSKPCSKDEPFGRESASSFLSGRLLRTS